MSEEREMLRDTVAAIVTKHATSEAVRRAMESERGYDESLWTLLCEQVGAAALVVPEELGGAGGELADAAVVVEVLGSALVPTPLLGTTLAELALLAARTALQTHGAIGYTQEHDLSLLILRVQALHSAWGAPTWHRRRVLEALAGSAS